MAADADGLLVDVVHAIDRVAAHRDRHTEGWPSTYIRRVVGGVYVVGNTERGF